MNGKPQRLRIALYVGILILYCVLFPNPLGKELFLVPEWKAWVDPSPSAPARQVAAGVDGELLGFVLGNTVGYVRRDGTLHYKEPVLHAAVVTEKGFINYSSMPELLVIKDPGGNILSSLTLEGYPFVRGQRLFMMAPDGCGIAEVSTQGEVLWRMDFNQLITSVDAGTTLLVLGFLDGSLLLLDKKGTKVHQEVLGQGPYRAVYHVSISPDEKLMGVVYGLNPQKVGIWERQPSGLRRVRDVRITEDFRRSVKGITDATTEGLVMEAVNGIRFVGSRMERDSLLRLEGKICSISYPPLAGLLIVCTEGMGLFHVLGITHEGKKVFEKQIAAKGPFYVRSKEGSLLLGHDQWVLKYRIGEG